VVAAVVVVSFVVLTICVVVGVSWALHQRRSARLVTSTVITTDVDVELSEAATALSDDMSDTAGSEEASDESCVTPNANVADWLLNDVECKQEVCM
jgi:hypothetical protein